MNLRPKLWSASRFPRRGVLSQWITTRTKRVVLRELLFIVRWLGAGLLLDEYLGTEGKTQV